MLLHAECYYLSIVKLLDMMLSVITFLESLNGECYYILTVIMNVVMRSIVTFSVATLRDYAECPNARCHHTKCCSAYSITFYSYFMKRLRNFEENIFFFLKIKNLIFKVKLYFLYKFGYRSVKKVPAYFTNLPFHQLAISPTCHFTNLPFHQLTIL